LIRLADHYELVSELPAGSRRAGSRLPAAARGSPEGLRYRNFESRFLAAERIKKIMDWRGFRMIAACSAKASAERSLA
jgi:hypothetical protein